MMSGRNSWRITAGYHPWREFRYAMAGITHAVLLDFSVQYKLVLSIAFLAIAAVFKTLFHFLFVLAMTGMMLTAEVFNTVVEALCDYVQPERDERIRHIKDMAAGATYITIVIWYVVLGVVLYELLSMNGAFDTAARHR
jgi:diacylglycerol kinase